MIRVFVAEDSAILRKEIVLTTPWQELGCEVVGEDGNGIAAEQKIRELHPEIVITDIRLPGQTGLEMIERLKDLTGTEYIVISAYSEFDFAITAIKLQVGNYLLKPIRDSELHEAVSNAVKRIQENQMLQTMKQDIGAIVSQNSLSFNSFEKELYPVSNPYLKKATQYMEANLSSPLTVGEVAEHLNISGSYLNKIFRKELSCSFNEYLTFQRIKQAIALIRQTDCKIYEISEQVGYKDYRYFSTQFKRLVGLRPTEYKTLNHSD